LRSSRIRPGPRGALLPYATPATDWTRFTLEEDDMNVPQRADDAGVRFVADPHYVDGHYGYTIRALDNAFGWVTARTVPPVPLRDEGIETDPGAAAGPITPR
jgi:hypothetical protein